MPRSDNQVLERAAAKTLFPIHMAVADYDRTRSALHPQTLSGASRTRFGVSALGDPAWSGSL